MIKVQVSMCVYWAFCNTPMHRTWKIGTGFERFWGDICWRERFQTASGRKASDHYTKFYSVAKYKCKRASDVLFKENVGTKRSTHYK